MSKLHWSLYAAVVLLVVAAGTVEAQQPGGGRGRGRGGPGGMFGSPAGMRMMLLANEKVQKELELNDEQKADLKKIGDDLRPQGGQNFQDLSEEERQKLRTEREAKMKEAQAKVDKLLVPQQQERLKQISWQVAGANALSDPEVADKLKLSDKQKDDLKAVQDKAMEEGRALFGAGLSREEAQAKGAELRKSSEEKTLAVLTPEQKTEFDKLKGDKFEISPGELFSGGAGGRGGRRGNRGAGAPANP